MEIDRETRSEKSFVRSARSKMQRIQFWMVWLSFAVLSVAGWMRMIDSITDWYWLDLAGVWPGPNYLAGSGGLWGAAGLVAAVWLLVRYSSGRVAATFIALGIALTYWIDRLFIGQAPQAGSNGLFALLVTLLWLAAVAQALRSWEVFINLYHRFWRKERP